MAAFLSLIVGFDACQFGSAVSVAVEVPFDGIVNEVELSAPGDANGDEGALHGWVTCILSLCINGLLCGGERSNEPLLKVSTVNKYIKKKNLLKSRKYIFM